MQGKHGHVFVQLPKSTRLQPTISVVAKITSCPTHHRPHYLSHFPSLPANLSPFLGDRMAMPGWVPPFRSLIPIHGGDTMHTVYTNDNIAVQHWIAQAEQFLDVFGVSFVGIDVEYTRRQKKG
jgi:hypothetical protein